MTVLSVFVRAAEDDPLKEVSLGEFAETYGDLLGGSAQWEEPLGRGPFASGDHTGEKPRYLDLGLHMGVSVLLLGAAAALLAQVAKRRGLAFAAVMAAMVLYAAVADRLVLAAHAGRLADDAAPVAERMVACSQAGRTFFYRRTAIAKLESVAADSSAPGPLRRQARRHARELGVLTDRTGIKTAAAYFATQHLGYRPANPKRITGFSVEEVKPELEQRFPIQLSNDALRAKDAGLWIACQRKDTSDERLARWLNVAFVGYRDGSVVRAVHVPRLSPAFARGGSLYLYWDHRGGMPQGHHMWLECDRDRGWLLTSHFRFARISEDAMDRAKYAFLTLNEFEKLVDGTHTPDGLSADGVALYDVEVLKKGSGALQSTVDWRSWPN
jgi:hypothetical protein